MKEQIINIEKKNVGEVELSEEVFSLKPNRALIYEVVKMQQASKRQGDASTKTHSTMSGTTAKIYRQKGTGRARHGDARANIFVGGAKSFGPHPRDYSYKMPKVVRKRGLAAALSQKKKDGNFIVLDDFPMTTIKTKDAIAVFTKLGVKKALVVVDGKNEKLARSVGNIPGIKLVSSEALNAYDLIKYEHTIITLPALTKIMEVLKI